MASYYDLVLALIPLTIAGMTAVLSFMGLSLAQSVPVASTVAALLIGHAMFVRSPVTAGTEDPGPHTAEVRAD